MDWESRSSFYRLAHGTMRRIIITHNRRKRPGRLGEWAEDLADERSLSPARGMEEDELLSGISTAIQDFLDRGDPKVVKTFLLSFFHRLHKDAGLRAEDLIADFTGERVPLREIADVQQCSIPTAWRRLGAALEFIQGSLRRQSFDTDA